MTDHHTNRWIRVDAPPPAKKTMYQKLKDYISFYKYSISHRLLFLVPVKYWDSWMRLWGQGEFHWEMIDDENDDSGTIFEEEHDAPKSTKT